MTNVLIDNGANPDFTIATETITGIETQLVGLQAVGGARISGDLANGLDVDVTRNAPLVAGTAIVGKFYLTDGTDDATISVAGARKPLDVHLIDSAGNVISTFGGAGGTSATDDADFTQAATVGTPIMGVYESSPTGVTDGDMGMAAIDQNRRWRVSVDASTLDVAHDAVDSGNPVLTGSRAVDALPAAVAANDRARGISDLFGRKLWAHVTPGMQVWKSGNYTAAQTSTALWTPAAGKKIAVTHLQVNSYGTTAGRIILYFSEGAYVEGTSQPLFKGKHSPTSSATPGALPPLPHPIFCTTADMDLRITTDAAISLDVIVYGYEF